MVSFSNLHTVKLWLLDSVVNHLIQLSIALHKLAHSNFQILCRFFCLQIWMKIQGKSKTNTMKIQTSTKARFIKLM